MNTKNISSKEETKKIDTQNVYGSIEALPNQCLHAIKDASKVKIPKNYKDIDSVVMCGMGGSGLGARVINSLYSETLNVPLVLVNDYSLPGFVNKKTLLICSSYSGNTEETISCFKKGLAKGTKMLSIGTGGELIKLSQKNNIPFYKIDSKHNPSNQPRMAIGYSIIGLLCFVSKLNLIDFEKQKVLEIVGSMKEIQKKNNINVELKDNFAKKMAKQLFEKNICLLSSQHLVGAMHVFNNQLNENSKVLTADYAMPEFNHHLLEGLKHPRTNIKNAVFVLTKSKLFSKSIQKRMELTKNVIEKNHIDALDIKLSSASKLSQVFELIQFGAYVNYYLALLYNQDPAPIPWVDYFKKKLSQQPFVV